ncbi:MAG: DNA-binding protein [Cyanobacteria bacterium P01_G01_bin.67]
MSNSLTTSENIILSTSDFDPPLKRKEATVPGYWTIDELATELSVTIRKVQYDITGNPKRNRQACLKAYKAGPTFLVADTDALIYIKQQRERQR